MRKLAVLRDDEGAKCPFGLSVPKGCGCASDIVDRMAPAEDEAVAQNNERLIVWSAIEGTELKQCKYASRIFENQEMVDCTYGQNNAGEGSSTIMSQAPYEELFDHSLDGLLTYPPGGYNDYHVWRNSYFGQYSVQDADDGETSGNKKT